MRAQLDLQSEPFSATGNLAGEGLLNPLGRLPIDPLTVMLREAVQNSWDARLKSSIDFSIEGHPVRDAGELTRRFFGSLPLGASSETLPVFDALQSGGIHTVLSVSDRRTKGLAGPTRADEMSGEDDPRDFVEFLRNVGEPPDRRVTTGGTYGYGKAALYLASEVQTLAVYTRCRTGASLESRFIISCVGPRYVVRVGPGSGRYTGRHWWGDRRGDMVEPLLNSEADEAAMLFGLAPFAGEATGTSIGVLNPRFEDGFGYGAMAFLVEGFVWYFWPKMLVGPDGSPPIRFEASWNGHELDIPSPEAFPPLDLYVAAYKAAKAFAGEVSSGDLRVRPVTYYTQRVATLAARRGPFRPRGRVGGAVVSYPRPVSGPPDFSTPSHHVALMRGPELVVRYVPSAELPSDVMEYGGVLIASDDHDRYFADAEPPAHDDWVIDNLDGGSAKGIVRAALNAARDVGKSMLGEQPGPTSQGTSTPTGDFSNYMGAALLGERGDGPGDDDRPGGGGGGVPGARITPGEPEYDEHDGVPVVVLPFVIHHKRGSIGSLVSCVAAVVLEDGSFESDLPVGAATPMVVGWRDPRGEFIPGDIVQIDADIEGDAWAVIASVSEDFMTGLDITAAPLEAPKR